MIMMMMMMMVLCPKAGSLAFTPPGDEMSEVVSRCLPHRQLWVSNLSKVATWRLERDSNPRPSDRQAATLAMRHQYSINVYNLDQCCATSFKSQATEKFIVEAAARVNKESKPTSYIN